MLVPALGLELTRFISHQKTIKVGIYNHPSLLDIPKEFEQLRASGIPSLWNTCETDQMVRAGHRVSFCGGYWLIHSDCDVGQVGPEEQKKLDEVFKGDEGYKRNCKSMRFSLFFTADTTHAHADFAGQTHGYAIRGDPTNEEVCPFCLPAIKSAKC